MVTSSDTLVKMVISSDIKTESAFIKALLDPKSALTAVLWLQVPAAGRLLIEILLSLVPAPVHLYLQPAHFHFAIYISSRVFPLLT